MCFAIFTGAHLTSCFVGIVLAVRRCLMQKALLISANEFALLLTHVKQQSASIIDLVLDVFGGKLNSDGNVCLSHC